MARATVTTTAAELIAGADKPGPGDTATRSFILFAAPGSSGTALLQPGATDDVPADWSEAARWDFGTLALEYDLEPGRSLYAKTETGTLDLDILPGGER